MLRNIVPTIPCMTSDLICGYAYFWCPLMPVDKRSITKNLPQSVKVLQILSRILHSPIIL